MISVFLQFLISITSGYVLQNTEYEIKFQDTVLKGVRLSNGILRFLNIPFAKPPVGTLRFKPPQPIGRFVMKILDASRMGKMCIQQQSMFGPLVGPRDQEQSEDCLALNIWTPATNNGSRGPLPVMVWIYGGSFATGSAQEAVYDGQELFKQYNDFVFVSFNYRLGVLGFLGGQQMQKQGSLNLGLQDQKLALEWISDNIHEFGGDPSRITVAGESAGGMSISAHMLAQSTNQKQLFHQAMLLSGPPEIHHLTQKEVERDFDLVASVLSCPLNEDTVLECLQSIDAFKLRDAGNKIDQYGITLDDEYVTHQSLISLLDVKQFIKIPLLIHVNQNEGSVLSLLVNSEQEATTFKRKHFHYFTDAQHELLDAMYSTPPSRSPGQRTGDLAADVEFNCMSRVMAQVYSNAGQKVFKVQNKHVNRELFQLVDMVVDLGVYHTSELPHLFQHPSIVSYILDKKFSLGLQRRYLDFVRTGSPGWPDYASSGGHGKRYDIQNNIMEDDVEDTFGRCGYLIDSMHENQKAP